MLPAFCQFLLKKKPFSEEKGIASLNMISVDYLLSDLR